MSVPGSGTVRAPLRVCPLGAHVDHQGGEVTGLGLDRAVRVAFAPRADRLVRASSREHRGEVGLVLDAVPAAPVGDWADLLRGAVRVLLDRGRPLVGVDLEVEADLPSGGLGTSGSLGVAYLLALTAAAGDVLTAAERITLGRAIENDYLGVASGVLDQSMCVLCRRDRLLHLDCRDLGHELVTGPGPQEVAVLVVYSGFSDALLTTGFNRRVEECRAAAGLLGGAALGDVPPDVFAREQHRLPEDLGRRARHFFTELERVRAGVEAWRRRDLERFGRLVTESGRSSIVDYECGRPELVVLYEALVATPGVYGARFSGGGFRGSCLALVEPGRAERIGAEVLAAYRRACPDAPPTAAAYVCGTADGAEVT